MKKVIFIILSFFSLIPIVNGEQCKPEIIKQYQSEVEKLSYDLVYVDNFVDMNGDFLEGHFKLSLINMPSNYYAAVTEKYGVQYSDDQNNIYLNGGVYKVEIYNNSCKNAVKIFEIKVPSYKQYCYLDNNCEKENIWFDGTYEYDSSYYDDEDEDKVDFKLVVVLVSLIVIIITSIVVVLILRRRQKL